jgi:hypothetical protein
MTSRAAALFGRAATALTKADHKQNGPDDSQAYPDVEPLRVAGHDASADQAGALASEYHSGNKSNHPNGYEGSAPDSPVHSANLPSAGLLAREGRFHRDLGEQQKHERRDDNRHNARDRQR